MNGIKLFKLKKIKIQKGNIYKFLSRNDKFFEKFGEIYISEIKKNSIKGWNYHLKNKCHLAVISGKVRFHLIKERNKKFFSRKIILSSNNYKLLVISPKIFFSFKGIDKKNLIINFLQNPHQKKESKKFKKVKDISIK